MAERLLSNSAWVQRAGNFVQDIIADLQYDTSEFGEEERACKMPGEMLE